MTDKQLTGEADMRIEEQMLESLAQPFYDSVWKVIICDLQYFSNTLLRLPALSTPGELIFSAVVSGVISPPMTKV